MSLTRLRKLLRLTGFIRPITQLRRETDLGYLRTQESSTDSLTSSYLCGRQNHEKERPWQPGCTSVNQALNSMCRIEVSWQFLTP